MRSTIATCIMTSTVKNCLKFEPVSSVHSPIQCSPKSRATRPKVVHGCLVYGIKGHLSSNPILFANALDQFCETTSSIIQWYHAQVVSENTDRRSPRQPIVAMAHSQRRLWSPDCGAAPSCPSCFFPAPGVSHTARASIARTGAVYTYCAPTTANTNTSAWDGEHDSYDYQSIDPVRPLSTNPELCRSSIEVEDGSCETRNDPRPPVDPVSNTTVPVSLDSPLNFRGTNSRELECMI